MRLEVFIRTGQDGASVNGRLCRQDRDGSQVGELRYFDSWLGLLWALEAVLTEDTGHITRRASDATNEP